MTWTRRFESYAPTCGPAETTSKVHRGLNKIEGEGGLRLYPRHRARARFPTICVWRFTVLAFVGVQYHCPTVQFLRTSKRKMIMRAASACWRVICDIFHALAIETSQDIRILRCPAYSPSGSTRERSRGLLAHTEFGESIRRVRQEILRSNRGRVHGTVGSTGRSELADKR